MQARILRWLLAGVGVALLAGMAAAAALVVVWDVRIEFRPDGGRYVYVGQYRDGQYQGWGVMLHSDGWRHAGEWRDGKPNGRGYKKLPDGSLYMGGFRDWQFDGVGVFALSSGRRYVGEWRGGLPLLFDIEEPDGTRLEGEFHQGTLHGWGTMTKPDGTRLKGEFRHGLLHGAGSTTMPDGTRHVGEFVNGELAMCIQRWQTR